MKTTIDLPDEILNRRGVPREESAVIVAEGREANPLSAVDRSRASEYSKAAGNFLLECTHQRRTNTRDAIGQ
jgi:hypothetical protein